MRDKEIIIKDLTRKTLSQLFDASILYDTDRIIIKIKPFSVIEIQKALTTHLEYLLNVYSDDFEGDSEPLNDKGKVIDLLSEIQCYELCDIEERHTVIAETLMMEQMRLYGLRELVFCSDNRMGKRYYNPYAEIAFEILPK